MNKEEEKLAIFWCELLSDVVYDSKKLTTALFTSASSIYEYVKKSIIY